MTAFSPARILADMLLDKKAVWSMFRRRSDLVRENRDRREPMTTTVSCSSMARYRCTRCGVCIVHAGTTSRSPLASGTRRGTGPRYRPHRPPAQERVPPDERPARRARPDAP
jgi:hypothetical protein